MFWADQNFLSLDLMHTIAFYFGKAAGQVTGELGRPLEQLTNELASEHLAIAKSNKLPAWAIESTLSPRKCLAQGISPDSCPLVSTKDERAQSV